jgi:hypothetical protein
MATYVEYDGHLYWQVGSFPVISIPLTQAEWVTVVGTRVNGMTGQMEGLRLRYLNGSNWVDADYTTSLRSENGGVFGSSCILFNGTWVNPPGIDAGTYAKVKYRVYSGTGASIEAWNYFNGLTPLVDPVSYSYKISYGVTSPTSKDLNISRESFYTDTTPPPPDTPHISLYEYSGSSLDFSMLEDLGSNEIGLYYRLSLSPGSYALVSRYSGTIERFINGSLQANLLKNQYSAYPVSQHYRLVEGYIFPYEPQAPHHDYWYIWNPSDGILGISGYQDQLSGIERVFYRNPDDKKLYMQVNNRIDTPSNTVLDASDSELPCALQFADGSQDLYYKLTQVSSQSDGLIVRSSDDNWQTNVSSPIANALLPGIGLKAMRVLAAQTLGVASGKPIYRLITDGIDLWSSPAGGSWQKNYVPTSGYTDGSGMEFAEITRTPAGIIRIFYPIGNEIRSYVPIANYARYLAADIYPDDEVAEAQLAAIRYGPRDMAGLTMAGLQIVDTAVEPVVAPDAADEDNVVVTLGTYNTGGTSIPSAVFDKSSNKYYMVAWDHVNEKLVYCAMKWTSSYFWTHNWTITGPYDVADHISSGSVPGAAIDRQKVGLFFTRAGELRLYWWETTLKNATLELI